MTAELDIVGLLATNMRILRRSRGLTLAVLAQRMGCSERYLKIIEGGGLDPTINTIAELAAAMGIKPTQLFRPVLIDPKDLG